MMSLHTIIPRPAMLRQIIRAPSGIRTSLFPPLVSRQSLCAGSRQYGTAPNITQTSFWVSLIPKPLRRSSPVAIIKKNAKSKEWNPATFFIIIFLLIGSMSIQMIALRNESTAFIRRSDAKIGLLKEIIERIQRGEEVDVEGLLGVGDKKMEKEWEEVLEEIEKEDQEWESSRRPKPKHGRNIEAQESPTSTAAHKIPGKESQPKSKAPSGFY